MAAKKKPVRKKPVSKPKPQAKKKEVSTAKKATKRAKTIGANLVDRRISTAAGTAGDLLGGNRGGNVYSRRRRAARTAYGIEANAQRRINER